jgi:hypothetical protein
VAPPVGHPDQGGKRHRVGHPAAVEGQLAGLLVAADQQPALRCLVAMSRIAVVQADERPVVVAVAFGALAGRHALPCPRRDAGGQGVDAAAGAADPDQVVAGDRQDVADPAGLKLGPQSGVGVAPPTVVVPFLRSPGSSTTSTASGSPRCSTT